MPTKPQSFRPAPVVEQALAHNGGGRGLSHRLAQIADRYLEVLREARTSLPALSEAEWSLLRDSLNGTLHEPAAMIRAMWVGVDDSIRLDGLDVKWGVDGAALVAKLRTLDYAQALAVVEAVEAWWAGRGDAGAA